MRAAALLETADTRILIDCGPDIRMQLLPQEFRPINGVLLTHEHYDHTGGLDDLRPYCRFGDINIYANAQTVKAVRHNFPYCFADHLYPGVPRFNLHAVEKHVPFRVGGIEVTPIEVMHGRLPIPKPSPLPSASGRSILILPTSPTSLGCTARPPSSCHTA